MALNKHRNERSYEIVTEKYFCVRRKNRRRCTNILNCYFSKLTVLWLIKLNIYMWKTKFTSQQYLCCLLFSRNVQNKSVLHFSCTLWKKPGSQTFKCSSSNKPFLQCVCYWYSLLRWMFFILCANWKTLFSAKVYRYSEGFSSRHFVTFFERSVLKEVRILRYLPDIVTIECLYQSSKIYLQIFIL